MKLIDDSHVTLQEHFAGLPDPRMDRTKRHQLLDILAVANCTVVCGADSWVEIEEWGTTKEAWLGCLGFGPSPSPLGLGAVTGEIYVRVHRLRS